MNKKLILALATAGVSTISANSNPTEAQKIDTVTTDTAMVEFYTETSEVFNDAGNESCTANGVCW